MTQNRQMLLLFLLFFVLGGTLFWLIIGNKSTLIVNIPQGAFSLDAKGYRTFDCPTRACQFSIPFGQRQFCVETEGYYPLCKNISLPWLKKYEWKPLLTKIPEIKITAQKTQPYSNISHFIWKKETKELFLIDSLGLEEFITKFYDTEDPVIVPFLKNAFLIFDREVFFVDTQKKQKNRIYEGENPKIRVLAPTVVFMKDNEKLLQFFADKKTFFPLDFTAKLNHIAWCDNAFIYGKEKESHIDFYKKYKAYPPEKLVSLRNIPDNFFIGCGSYTRQIRLLFPDKNDYLLEW